MLYYFSSLITKRTPPPSPPQAPNLLFGVVWHLLRVYGIAYTVVGSVPYSSYANHAWSSYRNNVGLFYVLVWHLLTTWWPRFHHMNTWTCDHVTAVSYCHMITVLLCHILILSCCHILRISPAPMATLLHDHRVIWPSSHVAKWLYCHMIMSSDHQILMWS